jgi:pimeloyl-ACP methyl ester carboxylesterase
MPTPTLPGITAKTVTTPRLTTRVLFSGADDGIPVLFIHGNASSATYWEEVMLALAQPPVGPGYRGIAHDQRGYGDADPSKHIDATRGTGDLSDDAIALLDTLGIKQAHIAGHSMGGSVMWRMLIDYPARFLTATLVSPGSPYGFGGTKGVNGDMCYPDSAGSGGGTVNPTFIQLLAAVAGMLQILFNKKVGPEILSVSYTVNPLLMTIIGGAGTFAGPVLGAAGLHLMDRLLRDRVVTIGPTTIDIGASWTLLLGIVFIAVVLIFPQGLTGTWNRWRARRKRPAPAAAN